MSRQPEDVWAARIQAALGKSYRDGLRDGSRLMLDHIEARPGDAGYQPHGAYHGPLPIQLRAWLSKTRESLAEEEGT